MSRGEPSSSSIDLPDPGPLPDATTFALSCDRTEISGCDLGRRPLRPTRAPASNLQTCRTMLHPTPCDSPVATFSMTLQGWDCGVAHGMSDRLGGMRVASQLKRWRWVFLKMSVGA